MYRGDYEGLIIITRCLGRINTPAGYFSNNLKLVKLVLTSEILKHPVIVYFASKVICTYQRVLCVHFLYEVRSVNDGAVTLVSKLCLVKK